MQRGMLFHSISGHLPGVDIEQVFCALHERVDLAALEKAWQRAVDRHEVLRTTFHWEGLAEPQQIVNVQVRVEVEEKSETRNPNEEWAEWFEQWLEADR